MLFIDDYGKIVIVEKSERRLIKMKTKDLTFLAAGIALFVVCSMCLRVPVFENYYLCLGYIVMTVYIWCFNWWEGAIIGFFGVILYCLVGNLGFNGMPGWALGNVVIGLILECHCHTSRKSKIRLFRFSLPQLLPALQL